MTYLNAFCQLESPEKLENIFVIRQLEILLVVHNVCL